jgi:hypothetical protein
MYVSIYFLVWLCVSSYTEVMERRTMISSVHIFLQLLCFPLQHTPCFPL